MDEFVTRQIQGAERRGKKIHDAEAQSQTRLNQNQNPGIDTTVYKPGDLVDEGYPLTNPVMQPNRHTRPGAKVYANRDAGDGTPFTPTTSLSDPLDLMPESRAYVAGRAENLRAMDEMSTPFEAETYLTRSFQGAIGYQSVASNPEEADRTLWNTTDELENVGYNHLQNSEFGEEGVDDSGMMGLTMIFGAQIMRGATSFDEAVRAVGETGASDEQLTETWNLAAQSYLRASQNAVQGVPTTPLAAQSDLRYLAASAVLSDALGGFQGVPGELSQEELFDRGMMSIDLVKSNMLMLADIVKKAQDDPVLAEAVQFLLAAEEQFPTTAGDFGRHTYGMLLDPSTYYGAGLAAKVAKGSAVKQAFKKAGLAGAEAAAFGATYGGLYNYGTQNLSVAAGMQEGVDYDELGRMTGFGGALGFAFGSALSGVSSGVQAMGRRTLKGLNDIDVWTPGEPMDIPGDSLTAVIAADNNVIPFPSTGRLSAQQEFAGQPLPDDVIPAEYLDFRRKARDRLAEETKKPKVKPEEAKERQTRAVKLFDTMMNDTLEMNPSATADDFLDDIDGMYAVLNMDEIPENHRQVLEDFYEWYQDDPASFRSMFDESRNKLRVIQGGADEPDPDHIANLSIVRDSVEISDKMMKMSLPERKEYFKTLDPDMQKEVKKFFDEGLEDPVDWDAVMKDFENQDK